MLKKTGRIGVVLCALVIIVMMVSVVGCKKGPNLKGADIVIGSWWSNYDVNTYQPRTEEEANQLERRKKLLADQGFSVREVELSGWDDYFQLVTTNILAGNKDVNMYWLGADWAMTLYQQGLLYPVSDSSVDLTNREPVAFQKPAYNKMMEDLFTFNGKQYAIGLGQGGDSWQGNFLFWNKRHFREAGLDPDLLYDLQKNGTWTWDEFLRIARLLTRDINNDGIIDYYGLPCDDPREVMNAFIYGNNANWVTINNGRFSNATNRPEFIEAMQFYLRCMEEGVMKPRPAGAAWDWDFTEFYDGRVGMLIAAEWRKGQMTEMADDYGCVLPPKGPKAQNYRMSLTENVVVVPALFSPQEVDVILGAANLWWIPVDTDWKQGHYWAFRDRRAVDETVAMTKDSRFVTYRNFAMVPGFNIGELIWDLWEFSGNPAQLVEQVAPSYNDLIQNMNR